jgi:dipeptidyl aminopeptidase/acylaminoacyl peptidase
MFSPLVLLIGLGTPRTPLTVEWIMRAPTLLGHPPRDLRWSADGAELQFSWAKANGAEDPTYKDFMVKRDGIGLAPFGSRPFSERESSLPSSTLPGKTVSLTDGDIFLKDPSAKEPLRLTKSADTKEDPQLAIGADAVVYMHEGNLLKVPVTGGAVSQLTDIKATDEAPIVDSAAESALAKEESELFKTFPPGGRQQTGTGGRRAGSASRTRTYMLSPNGTHAVISLVRSATPGKAADVPNYVTRSGYPEMISGYQKVGGPQSRTKLLVVDIKTGRNIEIAGPRPGRTSSLRWAPNGKYAVTWAEAEDFKDAWLLGFDPTTDKVSVLWNEHDDAWIGGPGRNLLGWLPDSSRVYFESEKTGFANLMTVEPATRAASNLTDGPFEVSRVSLDSVRRRFIFVSSEGSPFKRHIDAVSFDGGPRQNLADYSPDEDAAFSIAPNGVDVAVVRSKPNHPAELFVNGVQVTETPAPAWSAQPWIAPTVVLVPARDGAAVPARLYKPRHWRRGDPAVIFVHGAGYLQNVYDGWSHYFREYMFHNLLAEHGYAVLDMDYRGSAGYGRAWRTAIYRHMGGKDLDDHVDGANWLVKNLGVGRGRIGIYGGSYGGFITLMAMFTTPDVFAAGAALRPVSDWANYNHRYTAEILNLPQVDQEAYRVSSPIYHAEGLKGELLICHGMVDTNVNFQDSVRLVERLIELGKTHWEVAPYPVEDHGFILASSWTDEYRRILALFDRVIGPGYRRRR